MEKTIEQQIAEAAKNIQAAAAASKLQVSADACITAAGHVVGMNIAMGELAALKAEKVKK